MKELVLKLHSEGKGIDEICEIMNTDYCCGELKNNDKNFNLMRCTDDGDFCEECVKSHVRRIINNSAKKKEYSYYYNAETGEYEYSFDDSIEILLDFLSM